MGGIFFSSTTTFLFVLQILIFLGYLVILVILHSHFVNWFWSSLIILGFFYSWSSFVSIHVVRMDLIDLLSLLLGYRLCLKEVFLASKSLCHFRFYVSVMEVLINHVMSWPLLFFSGLLAFIFWLWRSYAVWTILNIEYCFCGWHLIIEFLYGTLHDFYEDLIFFWKQVVINEISLIIVVPLWNSFRL